MYMETKETFDEIEILMKTQVKEFARLVIWLVIWSSLIGGISGGLVVAFIKK